MTGTRDVLAEVVQILVEVVGDDFLLDVEVGRDTTLHGDLALESIEFVALAEKLREHYGPGADPAALVSALELEEIMALTVGDLADHIAAGDAPAAQPAEV